MHTKTIGERQQKSSNVVEIGFYGILRKGVVQCAMAPTQILFHGWGPPGEDTQLSLCPGTALGRRELLYILCGRACAQGLVTAELERSESLASIGITQRSYCNHRLADGITWAVVLALQFHLFLCPVPLLSFPYRYFFRSIPSNPPAKEQISSFSARAVSWGIWPKIEKID